jgi:glycerophosphoryl diester phosphodiesterase
VRIDSVQSVSRCNFVFYCNGTRIDEMKILKPALLILSGAGLISVANYSAEVATVRPKKKVFSDPAFWVIAHRGFSGKYPENTMLAFEKAAELPIDAIELDVHTTRDGRIVVIHDATLDRTTDRSGRVLDLTYQELKFVDAGYRFDPGGRGEFPFRGQRIEIPLLEDVFKRFPNMRFVLEIKQTMPSLEESLYRLIRKYNLSERVIVASEHTEPLERFRMLNPLVATNLSAMEAKSFYRMFRLRLGNFSKTEGDALQIPESYKGESVVTRELVEAVKRKGLILHIWTVNDPADMRRLIDVGVDGIISDFPDRLLQVARSQEIYHGHSSS